VQTILVRLGALSLLAVMLQSCGGRTAATGPVVSHAGNAVPAGMLLKPKSISPALVAAPPMTTRKPASAMSSLRRPSSDVTPLGFTQIPGGAVFVTASPDGSMWVLSTQGGPNGQGIYHYVNGTWSSIPGAATRLAVAPDNSLWAVNSSGGIYHYQNGAWSTIAGGASDISIGPDGSVYVISSLTGNQYGNGIWRYANGTWSQLTGAGTRIAASWDQSSYNNVSPGGFYVVNAQQSIYYYNPQSGFVAIPGGAIALAPTVYGGLFVLGVPAGQNGNPMYYNNLATGAWTKQSGTGVSIATNSSSVYLVDAAGNIYQAPLNSTGPLPWSATQHQNFVAIAYGSSSPYHIGIFSPGQSTASATIDYTGCCIWQIAFDPHGNLVMATTNNGVVVYAPGNTGAPTATLTDQDGFSLATDPQGDYAIGGYNSGPNVVVYLGGVATSKVTVPGAPAFQGLALSPSGELATATSTGSVMTYPRGSTTSNRTIPVSLNAQSGVNTAILAYDGQGNLAIGSSMQKTIGIYAAGATSPSYSITLSSTPNALTFDGWNRLLVASGTSVTTYAAGSATVVRTFTSQTDTAYALGIGPQGDVAIAGNNTDSQVYQANGNLVTISGLAAAESIAVSP
jgi:hypothetical protein